MNSIRIKNPVSQFHCIKVHPFQDVNILLTTPEYRNPDLKIKSNFVELVKENKTDKQTNYICTQKVDITNWSYLTAFYLGSIWLTTDFTFSSFCILTDSLIKDKVTVVNPKEEFVFLNPGQVLEIIICDSINTNWDFAILPGEHDIKIEKISKDIVQPFQSFIQSKMIEYHFLFQFEDKSIDIIRNLENGVYKVGRVLFIVKNKAELQFSLDVILKLRKGKTFFKNNKVSFSVKKPSAMISNVEIQEMSSNIEEECRFFYNNENLIG